MEQFKGLLNDEELKKKYDKLTKEQKALYLQATLEIFEIEIKKNEKEIFI